MNGALLLPLLLTFPGYRFVRRFRPGAGAAEAAGVGGLIGLGCGLTLLAVAGVFGIPLTAVTAIGSLLVAAAVLLAVSRTPRAASPPPVAALDRRWTPAEIGLAVLITAIFLLSAWRASFYPVSAMDAHSYDGRARWIVAEKTLDLSIYHTAGITGANNLTYPPLLPLGLALGYWTGATEGKPIDSFYFLALLLATFGILSRRLPRVGALLVTALVAAIPELWLHASLCLTNLPTTAFLTAGFLTAADRLSAEFESKPRDRRGGWITAGLLLLFAAGIRADAVIPAAGVAILTGVVLWRRSITEAIAAVSLLIGPAILATIGWQLWLHHTLGTGSGTVFRASLMPDPELIREVAAAFASLLPNPELTGWVMPVFVVGLAAGLAERKSGAATAAFRIHAALAVITLLLLFALFQQIDPSFGGGGGSYLQNSLKRAFFYVLPVAAATGFLSPPVRRLVERLDRFQRS